MTQTQTVLAYMEEYGSIDPFRAFHDLGILRLGARIWELREAGVNVDTISRTRTITSGGVKSWAEYRIKKPLPGVADRETAGGKGATLPSKDNTTF